MINPDPQTICAIHVIDKARDGKGGHARLTGGGVGYTWVTIEFQSLAGHDITFSVSLYCQQKSETTPPPQPPVAPAQPPVVPAQPPAAPPQHLPSFWHPYYAGPQPPLPPVPYHHN